MRLTRLSRLFAVAVAILVVVPILAGPGAGPASAQAAPANSLFGMNLYITGLERSDAEQQALLARAQEAGVRWSREELSWANIQPGGRHTDNWKAYDARLQRLHDAGIAVVGILLTTPAWASGQD